MIVKFLSFLSISLSRFLFDSSSSPLSFSYLIILSLIEFLSLLPHYFSFSFFKFLLNSSSLLSFYYLIFILFLLSLLLIFFFFASSLFFFLTFCLIHFLLLYPPVLLLFYFCCCSLSLIISPTLSLHSLSLLPHYLTTPQTLRISFSPFFV